MFKFKNSILIGGLSAALALTCFTGCESWGHRNDERSEGRASDDHRITSQVKDELAKEPVYKFNNVDVNTFNGVVQLSGFVNTDDQKRRAAEIASKVSRSWPGRKQHYIEGGSPGHADRPCPVSEGNQRPA